MQTKNPNQQKLQNHLAVSAIQKKLLGKELSYKEIFALMDEISSRRLGPILTTYFAAAGFKEGFSDDELYYLTKSMALTGKTLHFKGVVADKHSSGGVSGTRTTMILVPIIAGCGIKIPKNSSRAITTPSGTADTMEVLANVTFAPGEIEKLVNTTGGCIVWGGHLGMAPADDIIIQVEQPLAFESYDKIIVSIMAKKVASGSTHIILDLPVGPTMKIKRFKDADLIAKKFNSLARKLDKKIVIDINETREPSGRGVGPVLECRDVLRVLEQHPHRPLMLEAKALRLSAKLLDLCFIDIDKSKVGTGEAVANEVLKSGKALQKMREIIKAQNGNPHVGSESLHLGRFRKEIPSKKSGHIGNIDNYNISVIGRILGSPKDTGAGFYLEKRLDEKIDKNDILLTVYSNDKWRMREAIDTLEHLPIYKLT